VTTTEAHLAAVAGARRRRGLPAAGPFDLAVLGLATFKAGFAALRASADRRGR
jgi:hypothetical protein